MFAQPTHNTAKKSADGKAERADAAVAPRDSQSFNPVWQSIAIRSGILQAKLTVGKADDPYEREADRVADQVMRVPAPLSHGLGLSITPVTSRQAQRKCDQCEEEEEYLQRKESSGPEAPATVPPIVHETLSSPGEPLDGQTRDYFEMQFGRDLGGVRVHTGEAASSSARAVHALAYTVGRDVVFQRGAFAPGSPAGSRLLAHELTHVIQQGNGSSGGTRAPQLSAAGVAVSDPSDSTEREADRLAEPIAVGQSAPQPRAHAGLASDRPLSRVSLRQEDETGPAAGNFRAVAVSPPQIASTGPAGPRLYRAPDDGSTASGCDLEGSLSLQFQGKMGGSVIARYQTVPEVPAESEPFHWLALTQDVFNNPPLKPLLDEACGQWVRFDIGETPPNLGESILDPSEGISELGESQPEEFSLPSEESPDSEPAKGDRFGTVWMRINPDITVEAVADSLAFPTILELHLLKSVSRTGPDIVGSFFSGLGEGLGSDFASEVTELGRVFAELGPISFLLQPWMAAGASYAIYKESSDLAETAGALLADPMGAYDQAKAFFDSIFTEGAEVARAYGKAIGEDVHSNVGALVKAQKSAKDFAYELGRILGPIIFEIVLDIVAPGAVLLRVSAVSLRAVFHRLMGLPNLGIAQRFAELGGKVLRRLDLRAHDFHVDVDGKLQRHYLTLQLSGGKLVCAICSAPCDELLKKINDALLESDLSDDARKTLEELKDRVIKHADSWDTFEDESEAKGILEELTKQFEGSPEAAESVVKGDVPEQQHVEMEGRPTPLGTRGLLKINIGGEGEVPGFIDVNPLQGNLRTESEIRKRNPTGDFRSGTAHALPFEDDCASEIVANKLPSVVLGDRPEQIAAEIKRVLAPGGTATLGSVSKMSPETTRVFEEAGFTCSDVSCRYEKRLPTQEGISVAPTEMVAETPAGDLAGNSPSAGVPDSVIKANKGFINGEWRFEQVINNGRIRYDLLPTEMADYLREQDKLLGGGLSPEKMEFNMTAKFGPKSPLPENQVPRREGGPPDPDEDLKPK